LAIRPTQIRQPRGSLSSAREPGRARKQVAESVPLFIAQREIIHLYAFMQAFECVCQQSDSNGKIEHARAVLEPASGAVAETSAKWRARATGPGIAIPISELAPRNREYRIFGNPTGESNVFGFAT